MHLARCCLLALLLNETSTFHPRLLCCPTPERSLLNASKSYCLSLGGDPNLSELKCLLDETGIKILASGGFVDEERHS